MIFKREHNHSVKKQEEANIIQNVVENPYEKSPEFLKELLKESHKLIDLKSKQQISQWTTNKEKKVHESLLPDNEPNYLAVMFEKSSPSQQEYIKSLMTSREDSIVSKIVTDEIIVKNQEDNDAKIKRIKNELDEKIKSMKIELGDFTSDQIKTDREDITKSKISNRSLLILENFKKQEYWKDKEFSEEGKRIKSFLSKMKKQKSEVESKYNQDLESRFKKLDEKEEEQKNKLKEQRHKEYLKNLEKQYKLRSHKRKEYFESKEQKIKEIQNFLASVNSKEPSYLKYERDFKDFLTKEEENRQKILKEIKEKHPTYNAEEVEEHMNKYMEMKEKYQEEKETKAEMEEELLNSRYDQLKSLYRSEHHKSLVDSKKLKDLTHEELTKNRLKVKQYANTVKETFKPLIDKRKRHEVLENIKILELSNDPTKKKIIKANGIIEFEDKKENDAYEKGVSYLEQLREINEVNRSRISSSRRYDERSNSALELSAPKKIDYLRESRPALSLKPTISDWKQLLQKKDYSTKDKLQRVLDRAESLELHAKQKQVELRNLRKSENVMEVKEESDKYYLESISARMVLLKDVVMK